MSEDWSDLLQQFPWVTQNPASLTETEPTAYSLLSKLNLDWILELQTPWLFAQPPKTKLRESGWKIHISGVPQDYAHILSVVAPILIRERAYFKVLGSQNLHELLNSPHWPRESAGKLFTIYPDDDESFRRIVELCDNATAHLRGPRILSDFRFKPDSLVHYRFGAFTGKKRLGVDGSYRHYVSLPDGTEIEDPRHPYPFLPPAVTNPFAKMIAAPGEAAGDLLLNNRFAIKRVIRHANKGGVYIATDIETDRDIIIKEARPYVGIDQESGRDAVATLNREARILKKYERLNIFPKLINTFTDGQHSFLAEELLNGTDLRRYATRHFSEHGKHLSQLQLQDMIVSLTRILKSLHANDLYMNDLNPNNVFVESTGHMRLIDPELVSALGEFPTPLGGTYGYSAPEVLQGQEPTKASEIYSLGATAYFLLTFRDPVFPKCNVRSEHMQRARALLEHTASADYCSKPLISLILRSMSLNPAKRPSLSEWQTFDFGADRHDASRHGKPRIWRRGVQRRNSKLSNEIARYATSVARYDNGDFPWPVTPFALDTHPTNLMNGGSGIVSVLAYLTDYGSFTDTNEVHRAALWLKQRTENADWTEVRAGLYHGRAGVAWALYMAGKAVGDNEMQARAEEILQSTVLPSNLFDVTHGLAGIGITALWMWQQTGDSAYLRLATEVGQRLHESVEVGREGAVWSVPVGTDTPMAGLKYYGFAHGTAGIGYFLDQLHSVTQEGSVKQLADMCFETIKNTAELRNDGAYWAFSRTQPAKWVAWCNGSAGIGTYLTARYLTSRDTTALALAKAAALSTIDSAWRMPTVQCHGLAGNGEFLIDLWKATGHEPYLISARDFARRIQRTAVQRDGFWLVPDESGIRISLDYGAGAAGVAAYLARICNMNAPRLFMLETNVAEAK